MTRPARHRVLLAKSSLEGHDRGIKVVSQVLVDAGMEVIYTIFDEAKEIAVTALDENVSIIGITFSVGYAMPVVLELMDILKENELDIPVIMGGILRPEEKPLLLEAGVKGIFQAGASPQQIIGSIEEILAKCLS